MSNNPFESQTFGNSLSLRVDGAIGTMSLSPNGRDAVLAGRKGLFIIDLDDPFTTPRWLQHITSWEVADVQWSPHHSVKPSWCISTSNQKALLWDLARPSNNAISHVLHRHTRAITDINFHPMDPEVLVTCSIDTFVYSWDMRSPRRPVGKWAEWRAGATQVKWSHNNPHQLVSSHDHSFLLWDTRKGAVPVLRVENAHAGKINGLDFSSADDKLTTCSNDGSIKIWDLLSLHSENLVPSVIMQADYPIARARSLPFGKDCSCGIMPLRGGGNAIHVINYQGALNENAATGETVTIDVIPDYSFRGHQGPIKDFLWRTLRSNYEGFVNKHCWEKFQLVSWSSHDYDLKLWPHDSEIFDIANYNPLHQQIFHSLVRSTDGSDSEDGIASNIPTQSPNFELSEETSLKKSDQYLYNTYCVEPPLSMRDYYREYNGDSLSSMAYFKIMQSQENAGRSAQLNHLDWISGVRMGDFRSDGHNQRGPQVLENVLGPTNLGEEVSIVGHKFPKLRFEKISVSTGHLVMTLKGPLPKPKQVDNEADTKEKLNDSTTDQKASQQNGGLKSTVRELSPLHQISTQSSSSLQPALNLKTANLNLATKENVISSQKAQFESMETNDELWKADQDQRLAFIRLEVKFPKSYPNFDDWGSKSSKGRRSHKIKNHKVIFGIEETHEITPNIRREMLEGLNRIAEFYTNKFSKFCLEPCLRFLMGDIISLDEEEIIREVAEIPEGSLREDENLIEVGSEDWVDDLVNLHNAASSPSPRYSFPKEPEDEDEEEEDADLIPMIGDNTTHQLGSVPRWELKRSANDEQRERIKHDTTPLPKGCGAVWSHSGQLVCFFLQRETEDKGKKSTEAKSGRSKPLEGDFEGHTAGRAYTDEVDALSLDSMEAERSDDHSDTELEDACLYSSLSSDASFHNDWDELIENDVPSKSRVRGLFKESMRVGGDFFSTRGDRSEARLTHSAGGTASNYKSSTHGDHSARDKRSTKASKGLYNFVTVADFSHLIPEKLKLASSYRVFGDSPERLARHNCEVARSCGFTELSEAWGLIELILNKQEPPETPHEQSVLNTSTGGSFYWGTHPYGHKWLIKELFRFFETKCDLQMLAMMSCVLHKDLMNFGEANSDPSRPLPPIISNSITDEKFNHRDNAAAIDHFEFFGSPLLPLQRAPPGKMMTRKPSITSYRNDVLFHKSMGTSGTALLRGISATSITAHSVNGLDSSPDLASNRRGYLESPQRQAKANAKKTIRSQPNKRGTPMLSGSQAKYGLRPPPTVTISMRNDEKLDIFDDTFTVPLLSDVSIGNMISYREQYAEMLYAWGLLYNRLTILKFNYPREVEQNRSYFQEHECRFGIRFKKSLNTSQLLLSPHTSIKSAKKNSWNSRKRNEIQICALCSMIVNMRALVCTNCEHILHPECALNWWSLNDSSLECPTGCGCTCLEYGF